MWGLRYIDNCVLRDRDTTGDGTLDERLYAMQDANWNVTAVADTGGDIQERYAYQAYGQPLFLDPNYTSRTASSFDWETLFAGSGWDQSTELYLVRNRVLHPLTGTWVQRDPVAYWDGWNLYEVLSSTPLNYQDPLGLVKERCDKPTCDACVKEALKNDPIMQKLKKLGGKGTGFFGYSPGCKPKVSCEKCGLGKDNAYNKKTKKIRICFDKVFLNTSANPRNVTMSLKSCVMNMCIR